MDDITNKPSLVLALHLEKLIWSLGAWIAMQRRWCCLMSLLLLGRELSIKSQVRMALIIKHEDPCWNVISINNSRKLSELKVFANNYDGNLLCFVETKIKESKAAAKAAEILKSQNILSNYNHYGSGRIWILFRVHMVINLFSSSAQGIHFHVFHYIKNEYTFFSRIYVANVHTLRAELWADLKAIKECMIAVPGC